MFTSDDPAIAVNAAVVEAARGTFSGDIAGMRTAIANGRRFDGRVVVDMAHGRLLFDLTEVFLAMFEGDTAGGRRLARERAESHLDADAGLGWFALGLLDLYTGRVVEARRSSGTAIEVLGRVDVGGLLGPAIALRAAADAQLGDRESAEHHLAALTGVMRQHVCAAALAAEAEAWLIAGSGDAEAATQHVAAAVAGFTDGGSLRSGRAVGPRRHHARPPGGGRRCHPDRRRGVARRLLWTRRPTSSPLWIPDRRKTLSPPPQRSPESARTRRLLPERWRPDGCSRERTVGEGRRRAELLARSLGERVSMPRSGPRDATELSDREWSIARAAAARERSREIADRLGLSVRTVDNHLRNIYRKLGVASRDELGRELGLESVP